MTTSFTKRYLNVANLHPITPLPIATTMNRMEALLKGGPEGRLKVVDYIRKLPAKKISADVLTILSAVLNDVELSVHKGRKKCPQEASFISGFRQHSGVLPQS